MQMLETKAVAEPTLQAPPPSARPVPVASRHLTLQRPNLGRVRLGGPLQRRRRRPELLRLHPPRVHLRPPRRPPPLVSLTHPGGVPETRPGAHGTADDNPAQRGGAAACRPILRAELSALAGRPRSRRFGPVRPAGPLSTEGCCRRRRKHGAHPGKVAHRQSLCSLSLHPSHSLASGKRCVSSGPVGSSVARRAPAPPATGSAPRTPPPSAPAPRTAPAGP